MSTGKIIAVVALAACVGGPLYLHNQVKTKAAGFAQSVDKIAEILPKDFKQEHTQEPGLFSTTGKYKLFVKDDKVFKEIGVVDYKMEHGIQHLFASSYPLTMTLDMNWAELPALSIPEVGKPYYVFKGGYNTNGSFNLDGVAQDLTVKLEESETEMVVSGNKMTINYDKAQGLTQIKNVIGKMVNVEAGEEFNNFVMSYKYQVPAGAKSGMFDVDFTLDNAKQGYAEFNGLNFNMAGGESGDYVNSSLKLKADKITSVLAGDKVFSFDMQMSLKDLDAGFYRKLAEVTDIDNLSVNQAEELIVLMKKMIDGGFKVSIDRLNITDSEDELKSRFAFILEKKKGEQETFINRSTFASDVYLKSPFVSSAINIIPPELRSLMVGKVNEISLQFLYRNGDVFLNNKPLPSEYAEFLSELLLNLEESLDQAFEEALENIKQEKLEVAETSV